MTDSPALQAALDPQEEPILNDILTLRDQLLLLKRDKSTYIKSHDVLGLYDNVVEQVHLLNGVRKEHGKPLEQNRVDSVLDDCFQLLSLFFLTIGRNNEAPALYSMGSTVKRLLDHLTESTFYCAKDLELIGRTLDDMQNTLERGGNTYSPHILTLLQHKIDACRTILHELKASISNMSPDLVSVHERLISIFRSISATSTASKFLASEIQVFQGQLKEIQESLRRNEISAKEQNGSIGGRDIVADLLDRCLKWAEIVLEKQGVVDERFKDVYQKLYEIRNQLERISLTQAWSLRETDLYDYQRRLDRIDESRVNGNFEASDGAKADLHTQRTLIYLLRRSYAYIYSCMISSEPVSEALLPVFNQLQTLRRCLLEVKRSGGVSSPREMYPYTMKLTSIDNMRVDGKFLIGAESHEGQSTVNALLKECFDIATELGGVAEKTSDINS